MYQIDEAEQQLEFLKEIQTAIGKSTELTFLSALLASKKSAPADKVLELLDESANTYAISSRLSWVQAAGVD